MTTASPAAPSAAQIATTAGSVFNTVMQIEPTVATIAGMFVPGAAPVVALVQPWLIGLAPFIERGLNDIATNNNTDLMGAFLAMIQHVTAGQPNAPALTPATGAVTA